LKAPDSFGYEKKTEWNIKKNVGGLFESFEFKPFQGIQTLLLILPSFAS
jgi:hypothetical protein